MVYVVISSLSSLLLISIRGVVYQTFLPCQQPKQMKTLLKVAKGARRKRNKRKFFYFRPEDLIRKWSKTKWSAEWPCIHACIQRHTGWDSFLQRLLLQNIFKLSKNFQIQEISSMLGNNYIFMYCRKKLFSLPTIFGVNPRLVYTIILTVVSNIEFILCFQTSIFTMLVPSHFSLFPTTTVNIQFDEVIDKNVLQISSY